MYLRDLLVRNDKMMVNVVWVFSVVTYLHSQHVLHVALTEARHPTQIPWPWQWESQSELNSHCSPRKPSGQVHSGKRKKLTGFWQVFPYKQGCSLHPSSHNSPVKSLLQRQEAGLPLSKIVISYAEVYTRPVSVN